MGYCVSWCTPFPFPPSTRITGTGNCIYIQVQIFIFCHKYVLSVSHLAQPPQISILSPLMYFFHLYVYCISFWTVCSDFNPDLVNLTLVDVWLNQIEIKYGKKEPYCNTHVGCPTDFPIKFCLTDVKLSTLVSHRE